MTLSARAREGLLERGKRGLQRLSEGLVETDAKLLVKPEGAALFARQVRPVGVRLATGRAHACYRSPGMQSPGAPPAPTPPGPDAGQASPPGSSAHKDRFRASLRWALDAYARTLAKLAR